MFTPTRSVQQTEVQKTILLANSITVTIGDAIGLISATVGVGSNSDTAVVGAGTYVLGIVTGFTNAAGQVLSNGDQTSIATGTAGTTYATYIPAESIEWYADLSAVSGTTTNSDKPYVYFLLGAGHPERLLETSVTNYGTVGQFLSFGPNPLNSSQVIGRFVQSTFYKTT